MENETRKKLNASGMAVINQERKIVYTVKDNVITVVGCLMLGCAVGLTVSLAL